MVGGFGGASSLCLSVICFAEEKRDSQNARHVLAKVLVVRELFNSHRYSILFMGLF